MFKPDQKISKRGMGALQDAPAPAGMSDAAHVYYAAFHAHDASLRSARKERLGFFLIIVLLAAALVIMLPLRKVETRIIEVETATGRAVVSDKTPKAFSESPERLRLKLQEHFLNEFVRALMTLDEKSMKEHIPTATSMLSGEKAKNAIEEYIYRIEKIPEKLAQNPGLNREYQKKSVVISADGKTAYVRFIRIDKINGVQQNAVPMLVTIEFVIVPEEPGKEKDNNPMGLRITFFTVALDV